MKSGFLFLFFSFLALWGCRKGEPLDNLAPETSIFVESINLTGANRLTSEVRIYWSGTDPDGFIKGFEISFDNQNWHFTTQQDSLFTFDLTGGVDTLNIDLWVRAIDGADVADVSPAYLRIPIRNSPPSIKFDSTLILQDTMHIVASLIWNVSDPDGAETLDSVFVKINSGEWYPLSSQTEFVTFVPQNNSVAGPVSCGLWANINNPQLLSQPIAGLILEDTNRVYIKARDIAGSWSETDTSKVFFVRKKTADFLLLDSHSGMTAPTPETVYFSAFSTLGISFDYLDLNVNSNANLPPISDPTFGFILAQYSKLFWYSDEGLYKDEHFLNFFASILQKYLNNGGKVLISTKFPTAFLSSSPVFGFSPMDSLSTSPGQARIPTDSIAYPVLSFSSGYDSLKASAFISGADPFYAKDTNSVVYRAQVLKVGGWIGSNAIAAKTTNGGRTNQVFFSVELHNLNSYPLNLQTFLSKILNNEFNW